MENKEKKMLTTEDLNRTLGNFLSIYPYPYLLNRYLG